MLERLVETMQFDEVKELIDIFEKTDLNDMEVQLDNAVVRLNRGSVSPWAGNVSGAQTPQNTTSAANVTAAPKAAEALEQTSDDEELPFSTQEDGSKIIKAPIVGTFYQSAAPDEPPFVKVGDTISEGEVVCIIEAMKFMNEVNSTVSGTITEVLVKDGDFVEYGQELFRVK